MPVFDVTLRYSESWIGHKIIRAIDEDAARDRVEKLLETVSDYDSFAKVADKDTIEIEGETMEVDQIDEV